MVRWLPGVDRDALVRRVSLFGVIVATAVLSYSVLRDRALHVGFPAWASWFYPIGLDALILGGSRVWTDVTMSRGTRRLAMGITLGAIVAGVLGFVGEFAARGWVAVAFACLVPAALAASLVLTSRVAADRRDAPDTERSYARGGTVRPIRLREPDAPTAVLSAGSDADAGGDDRPAGSAEERRAWIHERLDAGEDVVGADVDRAFPDAARNGARLVREVKSEREREMA